MIYLDNNSTTKIAAEVLSKMNEVYALPLNSLATHQAGRKANYFLDEAREEIKNLLNAQSYEVIFTGSATEANNMVICGNDNSKVLFSKIEHASIYECRPTNKEIIEIEVLENGLVDISDLEKKLEKISGNDFLVSVMLANNETGAIQQIAEIAKLTHQKGGLIHSDIVQAAGKIAVDLEKLNLDFATITAHKINGPQGVGALLIRKGLDIKPLIFGGKQEKSKRAGTSNVAGISGFGESFKLAAKKIVEFEKVKILRDFLESEIKKIAGENIKIFSNEVVRLPNTSYISLRNADNQTQLIHFDLNGICVSAGAACSSGTLNESRILKAMKVEKEFLNGAIRVSLGLENTKEEIQKFVEIWHKFYNNINK